MKHTILRTLWLVAVIFGFAVFINSCTEKAPEVPETPETPEQPEEPEIKKPEPPYTVVAVDFQTTRGALKIGGKLYLPEELESYTKPAAIFCTGLDGSWKDTEPYAKSAARMGIVSCCFDFCGGPAGESLSDGSKSDNTISTEVQDLTSVYAAIKAREDVDAARICLMGGSQGGLVTALYAAEHPDNVKALGLMFPAFNLPDLVRQYAGLFGGIDNLPDYVTVYGHVIWRQYAKDAYTLYPFESIGKYEGPVLILHGTQDTTVPLSYSQQAIQLYKNASLTVMEGQGHGFDAAGTEAAVKYLEDFFLSLETH